MEITRYINRSNGGVMKIALVSMGSYGDNCNSTLMFKPIKDHYKDCGLEIHTSTKYASAYFNCPYIDKIITYPANNKSACFDLYNTIPDLVRKLDYDKVFVPAPILYPNKRNSLLHPEFGQNIITTFMRVLEDEGISYEWPVKTLLCLNKEEIRNVYTWLDNNNVRMDGKRNILMEVHHESGQSFWNTEWTLTVARHLMKSNTNLFISSRDLTSEIAQLEKEYKQRDRCIVRWTSSLSIRECAELYNRCDVFFSVSSGLSNACNTNYCRTDLKWIETINDMTVNSAPVRAEGKIFWYRNNIKKFIEMLTSQGI